jgi:hypothetical protein
LASTTKTLRQIRSLGYARQPWCIIRAREVHYGGSPATGHEYL